MASSRRTRIFPLSSDMCCATRRRVRDRPLTRRSAHMRRARGPKWPETYGTRNRVAPVARADPFGPAGARSTRAMWCAPAAGRQNPDGNVGAERYDMKRKTLDRIFAGGGLLVAALLATLGFALGTQYAFATEYVKTELGAQKITFAAADKLTAEEKDWKAGSACLTTYAGQPLETGPRSEERR